MTEFKSGAVIDTRPLPEQEKDYRFEEIVASAATVDWQEKPADQWRRFPIFNQNGSGSCVAQTQAKEMGIMRSLKDGNYVHFSATDIYQRRANKPAGGMSAVDARRIATEGVTLEALAPSQNMTDAQMDGSTIEPYKREVGDVFKIPNYVALPIKDIDALASVIQHTQKGLMLWFYAENAEWTGHPEVLNPALDLTAAPIKHSITGVDAALVNGKKSVIIEDSWGPGAGLGGQRVIDEDFLRARNWYAGYLVNFRYTTPPDPSPAPNRPRHTFSADLELGQRGSDVIALQDILKYEGLFPINTESTGYYGPLTASSVGKFQIKHGITTKDGPGYGRTGPKTRAQLNLLYGA